MGSAHSRSDGRDGRNKVKKGSGVNIATSPIVSATNPNPTNTKQNNDPMSQKYVSHHHNQQLFHDKTSSTKFHHHHPSVDNAGRDKNISPSIVDHIDDGGKQLSTSDDLMLTTKQKSSTNDKEEKNTNVANDREERMDNDDQQQQQQQQQNNKSSPPKVSNQRPSPSLAASTYLIDWQHKARNATEVTNPGLKSSIGATKNCNIVQDAELKQRQKFIQKSHSVGNNNNNHRNHHRNHHYHFFGGPSRLNSTPEDLTDELLAQIIRCFPFASAAAAAATTTTAPRGASKQQPSAAAAQHSSSAPPQNNNNQSSTTAPDDLAINKIMTIDEISGKKVNSQQNPSMLAAAGSTSLLSTASEQLTKEKKRSQSAAAGGEGVGVLLVSKNEAMPGVGPAEVESPDARVAKVPPGGGDGDGDEKKERKSLEESGGGSNKKSLRKRFQSFKLRSRTSNENKADKNSSTSAGSIGAASSRGGGGIGHHLKNRFINSHHNPSLSSGKHAEVPNTGSTINCLQQMVMRSVDTIAVTALPLDCWLKERLKHWCQLSGHAGTIMPATDNTLWKKRSGNDCNEAEAYRKLMNDVMCPFVPQFKKEVEHRGEYFIEIDDLTSKFTNPAIMDVKIGIRTFLESEVKNPVKRHDLYIKMTKIDPSEPTEEENVDEAVTKLRYMQFRERESSTAKFGCRVEAIKLPHQELDRSFQKVRTRDEVMEVICSYFSHRKSAREPIIERLKAIRSKLPSSEFFRVHEVIGSSLLFMYDEKKSGVWLIDFAKAIPISTNSDGDLVSEVDHLTPWALGNHEDGYLTGLDNLIAIISDSKHKEL